METIHDVLKEKRYCKWCGKPLEETDHGNRKSHPDCASYNKRLRQNEKYKIGNSAKLMIQKNESVAAYLYKMDQQKRGISHLAALELGLKFNCPTTMREHLNKKIYFFDNYGYSIETVNGATLIYFYHENDLQ
jgi:hypothetical protein